MPRDRRERFRTLAEKRTNSALRQIRLLANLSNTGNYSYEDDEIKQIRRALMAGIKRMDLAFRLAQATDDSEFTIEEGGK